MNISPEIAIVHCSMFNCHFDPHPTLSQGERVPRWVLGQSRKLNANRITFLYAIGVPYYSRMLRVVILKPSKYGLSGYVERFRRGFMPNSTVRYIRSMTPTSINGVKIETHAVYEFVTTDPGYP